MLKPHCSNFRIITAIFFGVWTLFSGGVGGGIRVFAVRMKEPWVFSYPMSAQWRLWSYWVDAQADLILRWAHKSFCWFCHAQAHLIFILAISVVRFWNFLPRRPSVVRYHCVYAIIIIHLARDVHATHGFHFVEVVNNAKVGVQVTT